MNETKEFVPASEDQQLARGSETLSERRSGQKSQLSLALAATRAKTHIYSQETVSLFPTIFDPEPRNRYTSPTFKQLSDRIQTEEAAQGQILFAQDTIQSKIGHIIERVQELTQVGGIRKILTGRRITQEIRSLEEQRTELQKQSEETEAQKRTRQRFLHQLFEQFHQEKEKDEEKILAETGQRVQAIVQEYQQFLNELFQDSTIIKEIREEYIKQFVAPEIDNIFQERPRRKAPLKAKEAFLTALKDYLEHQEDEDQKQKSYQQKLENKAEKIGLVGYEDFLFGPLRNGGDKKMIQHLLARMAAEDIKPIEKAANSYFELEGSNKKGDLSSRLTKAINPTNQWESFGQQILQQLDKHTRGSFIGVSPAGCLPEIQLWQAVKFSSAVREIFSGELQEQDQDYYSTLLNRSLGDSSEPYIDSLYYYPTPESIRNLVVVAAADAKNYRTFAANRCLYDLRKRPDWKNILDETEKVYPSLKPARLILESWNYIEQGNHPEIQEAAEGLTSIIFTGDLTSDQRLKDLAREAVPNRAILDILARQQIIKKSEATTLKEAEDFLKKRKEETLQQYQQNVFSRSYFVEDYFFRKCLRENLFALMQQTGEKETKGNQITVIKRFETLSQMILQNKTDNLVLEYFTSGWVIDKLQDQSLTPENITFLLEAYKEVPTLASNPELCELFCKQFTDQQTVQFFKDMVLAYDKFPDRLIPVLRLVRDAEIIRKRALELPTKASNILKDDDLFSLVKDFPKTLLTTDQGLEFLKKIKESYPKEKNNDKIREALESVTDNHLNRQLAIVFPEYAPALMNEEMERIRKFIFNRAEIILKDVSDIRFLNSLVGEFGKKSDQIIRDYCECLSSGVITTTDKGLVLEFVRQLRALSPPTIQGYKEAKQSGYEKAYLAQLLSLAEKMTGAGIVTTEEREKTYYKDLLKHIYPNNSGNYGSFKSAESCSDKSSDLTQFKIKPRYEIDLLSQSKIRVKAGETLDAAVKQEAQKPILEAAEKIKALEYDKEKIKTALSEKVDKVLEEIIQAGGLKEVDIRSVTTLEEKLFLILTDSTYGNRISNLDTVKELVIFYEFATFEDIRNYLAGTTDRVDRADNQDYALLCELDAFYSDKIKEINRQLAQVALRNPTIATAMPEYFKKLGRETALVQRKEMINKLQVDKLGISENFVRQVGKILEKRKGKKYAPDEVRAIIRRYESWTGGLQESASTSPRPETRAFYGQLRSQRERTFEALKAITGQEIDPRQVYLGEINLQQALSTEANIKEGKYNEEQFASYTVQRFLDLFEEEKTKIEGELAKFESLSGKQREVLYGYITKTKESAHARMTGGVCVAGDNPDKDPKLNMWNMPNYLQLVFQEQETFRCQGLVLLHHFDEKGKRILTASFNPSSTYVYSVDEEALFNGILDVLKQFVSDNKFDMITVSRTHFVRTNRTGGEFEKAIDKKIAQVGKTFEFDSPQQFSYHPSYQIQEMDVIWEKD